MLSETVEMIIIGQGVLKFVYSDSRTMLKAACDCHGGTTNVFDTLSKDGNLRDGFGSKAAHLANQFFIAQIQRKRKWLMDPVKILRKNRSLGQMEWGNEENRK